MAKKEKPVTDSGGVQPIKYVEPASYFPRDIRDAAFGADTKKASKPRNKKEETEQ